MKLLNKNSILALGLCSVLFATSCSSDLDVAPGGSTMTQDALNGALAQDPSKLSSMVTGLYANMIKEGAISAWYGSTRHYDYGYASAMMIYDNSGQDEVSINAGYNWYRNNMRFADRTEPSDITYFLWNMYYSNIKAANDIIKSVDMNTANATAKAYVGEALGMRAFCYLNLIQTYQFTYKGHEDAEGVPIVTEATTSDNANNNPRASVKDVYSLIISDLTKAIGDLTGSTRSGKEHIDVHVAYGLRARANLVMQNWNDAASDAAKAAEGFTPLSKTGAAAPGFNDIGATNWMWGMDVNETNDIVQSGIINFPSMMCAFTGNGYSPTYAPRLINSKLWAQIPSTDVRKGWWLDKNFNSPIIDTTRAVKSMYEGKTYVAVYNASGKEVADINYPYQNVKFGAYKNDYGNETNACDVPLMRVEEMLLIQAEAKAMGGDVPGGKAILENFVRTYRDPNYTCTATTAEDVQNAVWLQRRVELWGEGFSFFDLLRLKKPLDRTGTNYESSVSYQLPAESQIFLWIIPEDEINNNAALKGHNNPVVAAPAAK